jgi:mitochondrial inner membrane protein COX18
MLFSHLARNPASCFDSESFLTLTTLVHPDETFTLPVVLGLLTMANVEASTWVLTPAEKAKLAENEAKRREMSRNDGLRRFNPQSILKSTMRGLAVARIGLGAVAPGVSSLVFSRSVSGLK